MVSRPLMKVHFPKTTTNQPRGKMGYRTSVSIHLPFIEYSNNDLTNALLGGLPGLCTIEDCAARAAQGTARCSKSHFEYSLNIRWIFANIIQASGRVRLHLGEIFCRVPISANRVCGSKVWILIEYSLNMQRRANEYSVIPASKLEATHQKPQNA